MKDALLGTLYTLFVLTFCLWMAVPKNKETSFYAQKAYGKAMLENRTFFSHPFHPSMPYYSTSPGIDLLAAKLMPKQAFVLKMALFSFLLFASLSLYKLLPLWTVHSLLLASIVRSLSFFSPLFFSLLFLHLLFLALEKKKFSRVLLVLLLWAFSHESFLLGLYLSWIETRSWKLRLLSAGLTSCLFLPALLFYYRVPFVVRADLAPGWHYILFLLCIPVLLWRRNQSLIPSLLFFTASIYMLYPYAALVLAGRSFQLKYNEALKNAMQHPFVQDLYLPRTETVVAFTLFLLTVGSLLKLTRLRLPIAQEHAPFLESVRKSKDFTICHPPEVGDLFLKSGFNKVYIDSKGAYAYPEDWTYALTVLSPEALKLPCQAFIVPKEHPLRYVMDHSLDFLLADEEKKWVLFFRNNPEQLDRIARRFPEKAQQKVVRKLMLQAQRKTESREFKKAIDLLEKALSLRDDLDLLTNLASLYMIMGKLDRAEALLDRAEQKDALYLPMICNKAILLEQKQKRQKALDYYKRCDDFGPPDPEVKKAIERLSKE